MRVVLALAVLTLAPALACAQTRGWVDLDLGGGHRARRYLPTSVRTCDALPLLLFLHGAGGTPEVYEPHLTSDAEALGLVLLLPLSTSAGWSDADVPVINAALDAVDAELNVDVTRTYVGGHSAGGAFAYLLAYSGTGLAAVFTLSAPYYGVSSVAEPTYRAPIHMYYGDQDPNYTGGAASALAMQWTRLGVPNETDVQAGFGHSTWPPSSVRAGFDFLLAHRYPGVPGGTCGGPDASAGSDAGARPDAGMAGSDAGLAVDASTGSADATTQDAGGPRRIATGCGCRAGSSPREGALAWLALVALPAVRRRRRARQRRARAAASSSC